MFEAAQMLAKLWKKTYCQLILILLSLLPLMVIFVYSQIMEYKCGVTGPNTPLSILLGIQLTYELGMQSQVAHLEGDIISRILERFLFLDLKHLSAFLFMVPEKVSKTFKNDFCESLELVQR